MHFQEENEHLNEESASLLEDRMFSINGILKQNPEEIGKKVFKLVTEEKKQEKYLQIKIHKILIEERQEISIQFIDISTNILNK